MIMRYLLLLLCFVSCLSNATGYILPEAKKTLTVDPFLTVQPVGLFMDLYEDKTAELRIEQVMAVADEGKFYTSDQTEPSIGTTSSAWWVHITLENVTDEQQSFILKEAYSLVDNLQLWQIDNNRLTVRETGDMLPFSAREIKINALSFEIELAPNSKKSFFLRYKTQGALSFNLSLNDRTVLLEKISLQMIVQGLFYGALIALAFYNLFIFIVIRDVSYLLYVLYLLALGFFLAAFNGLSSQYLMPESPWWANHSLLMAWGLVLAMALIFSKNFLNIKQHSPLLNRLTDILAVIAFGCTLAAFFLPYGMVIEVLLVLAPPSYILILFVGLKGVQRGYTPARYFLVAWSSLMVSAIASTLISAGVIDRLAAISPYIVQGGAAVEAVLLALALASRIRELEQDALTDSLTELYNRRFFDRQLQRYVDITQRQGSSFSLVLIDIDHFKNFNDTFGHDKGDVVLKHVANHLSKTARNSDVVCRFGGEEFAIILPDTSSNTAWRIAERIRTSIEALDINGVSVTVSAGIATYNCQSDVSELDLFQWADASLYAAKAGGRNCVRVYGD